MKRLSFVLLPAVLLGAVTTTAYAGAKLPPRCLTSQLHMAVATQGENTTTRIGVTLHNRGAACVLSRALRLRLAIEHRGALARVRGNPLALDARGRIGRGGTRRLAADWSNWCGPRDGLETVARLGGATVGARFATLPVCLRATSPSRLVPVR